MIKEKKQLTTAQEYLQLKQQHKDQLIFYRIGEFYELFFDDAIKVAKQLNLNLTHRGKHEGVDVPMCGVPAHAKDAYIAKLLKENKKIALYEQKHDDEHDLYVRYLKQIYTPGTLIDEMLLSQNFNNFLASIYVMGSKIGFAIVDLSTGEVIVQLLLLDQLDSVLEHWSPMEILLDEAIDLNILKLKWHFKVTHIKMEVTLNEFEKVLKAVYINELPKVRKIVDNLDNLEKLSMQSLLRYVKMTQCMHAVYLKHPKCMMDRTYLYIHQSAKDSLELMYSIDGKKEAGLLYVINQTLTPIGSRRMMQLLNAPMLDKKEIDKRLNYLEMFMAKFDQVTLIRQALLSVYDIERILVRIYTSQEKKIDYINIMLSLRGLKDIKQLLPIDFLEQYKELYHAIEEIYAFLDKNISTDIGNMLNLDTHTEYRNLQYEFYAIMKAIELLEERAQSDIGSVVKIRLVQGLDYVIEVPLKNVPKVPYHFQCIQTLNNMKRYTTDELLSWNFKYKQAQVELAEMEKYVLIQLSAKLNNYREIFVKICEFVADLDIYISFAYISMEYGYVRPVMSNEKILDIINGKHAVLYSKNRFFIPNNCYLDAQNPTMMLTGPNMSGKSTYMKQMAHIIILAQMGCFVPADNALIGIVHDLYTRFGLNDNITDNQSTFMCEMSEMSFILEHASERSFIMIDEIGRGTTPVEGEAIARAILHYMHTHVKARTIFATHFHALSTINDEFNASDISAEHVSEMKNIIFKHMMTKNRDILHIDYLYKLIDGISNCSYGLAVAKQAKIPDSVIRMAMKYLQK